MLNVHKYQRTVSPDSPSVANTGTSNESCVPTPDALASRRRAGATPRRLGGEARGGERKSFVKFFCPTRFSPCEGDCRRAVPHPNVDITTTLAVCAWVLQAPASRIAAQARGVEICPPVVRRVIVWLHSKSFYPCTLYNTPFPRTPTTIIITNYR